MMPDGEEFEELTHTHTHLCSHQAYLWGAGSILDAHAPHERIAISDLHRAIQTYKQMACSLLQH